MEARRAKGSCLCGEVRFAVKLPTLFCGHCHCSMCRRAHGAGYVTWVLAPRENFDILAGAQRLVRYRSSEHGTRSFCGHCGSTLVWESTLHPGRIDVVLANIDQEIDRSPEMHVFFDDRAAWVHVADGLPRLGGKIGLEALSD